MRKLLRKGILLSAAGGAAAAVAIGGVSAANAEGTAAGKPVAQSTSQVRTNDAQFQTYYFPTEALCEASKAVLDAAGKVTTASCSYHPELDKWRFSVLVS